MLRFVEHKMSFCEGTTEDLDYKHVISIILFCWAFSPRSHHFSKLKIEVILNPK